MKTNFIKMTCVILLAGIALIWGCKKDNSAQPATSTVPNNNSNTNTDNYSSMADFFAKNGVAAQTFTITNSTGGSFATPQGTVITIPANTFLNNLNQQVTGTVTITFKDIYKKSDMLLSNMPTTMANGMPLKSAGEFYINATAGGNPVNLANTITVKQPFNSPADLNMRPFVISGIDTAGWKPADSSTGQVAVDSSYMLYQLIQLCAPLTSGSWCNSDNPSYFSIYTQGTLTLTETDTASNYNTQVYLLFKSINTTDACHTYGGNDFNFTNCVPIGLQCTAVAVGVKNGKIYSSFIPVTITANQTVKFSMSETTTANFKSQLAALN
jgi:hypothetical protein